MKPVIAALAVLLRVGCLLLPGASAYAAATDSPPAEPPVFASSHHLLDLLVPADSIYAHGSDAMMNHMLEANPVNLHTHGLIVEPRQATAANPTWGDYSYLLVYPAGKLPSMVSSHDAATDHAV